MQNNACAQKEKPDYDISDLKKIATNSNIFNQKSRRSECPPHRCSPSPADFAFPPKFAPRSGPRPARTRLARPDPAPPDCRPRRAARRSPPAPQPARPRPEHRSRGARYPRRPLPARRARPRAGRSPFWQRGAAP